LYYVLRFNFKFVRHIFSLLLLRLSIYILQYFCYCFLLQRAALAEEVRLLATTKDAEIAHIKAQADEQTGVMHRALQAAQVIAHTDSDPLLLHPRFRL
jgi:hypothetical protein